MEKTYLITFREVGGSRMMKTSFTGTQSREYVIAFFGLEAPDVEWYSIEEASRNKSL